MVSLGLNTYLSIRNYQRQIDKRKTTMENRKEKIKEDDVLAALLKVKPTTDMPRPGATKSKAIKKETKPK
jgi:hypothetical protein